MQKFIHIMLGLSLLGCLVMIVGFVWQAVLLRMPLQMHLMLWGFIVFTVTGLIAGRMEKYK